MGDPANESTLTEFSERQPLVFDDDNASLMSDHVDHADMGSGDGELNSPLNQPDTLSCKARVGWAVSTTVCAAGSALLFWQPSWLVSSRLQSVHIALYVVAGILAMI